MGFKFNPFSGNFDQTGSGGGSSTVFDGEVQFFSDLPQTVGTPPVNSTYLVRESEGTIWFGNKKQKGIYIRSGNSGVRNNDWTYGGEYPVTQVNGQTGNVSLTASDVGALQSGFTHETFVYDGASQMVIPARRNARWNIDFVVTGGTRTIILPSEGVLVGDRIHISLTVPSSTTVVVRVPAPEGLQTVATLTSAGKRFLYGAQVTLIANNMPVWQTLGELQATIGASPSSTNSNGTIGTFVFTEDYMYICVASNTWRRVPVAAF